MKISIKLLTSSGDSMGAQMEGRGTEDPGAKLCVTPLVTKIAKITVIRNNTIMVYNIRCVIYSIMQRNKPE